jgi:hypothetical protein
VQYSMVWYSTYLPKYFLHLALDAVGYLPATRHSEACAATAPLARSEDLQVTEMP